MDNNRTGPNPKSPERFWSKVDKNGPVPAYRPDLGQCWVWTAGTSKGYGKFWDGRRSQAHRFSYEMHRGAIPDGLDLDHLCRVRNCVNPDHLEPVTRAENIRRGETGKLVGARQRAKTHCPRGHPYSGPNLFVETSGARACKACCSARAARRYARSISPRVTRRYVRSISPQA